MPWIPIQWLNPLAETVSIGKEVLKGLEFAANRCDSTKMSIAIRERTNLIFSGLTNLYPDVRVELDYSTPFELLIASVLAAQNNDKTINEITLELFRKYRKPQDYLDVEPSELETDIHRSGFFRQKTKAIRNLCEKLISDFGGVVPATMKELVTLPGVGRKTATVVLGEAMGIAEGITVDLHHLRVEPRLELSEQKTADKMEKDLMAIVPKEHWIKWGQLITWHGRRTCRPKQPKCGECVLNDLCPSATL